MQKPKFHFLDTVSAGLQQGACRLYPGAAQTIAEREPFAVPCLSRRHRAVTTRSFPAEP